MLLYNNTTQLMTNLRTYCAANPRCPQTVSVCDGIVLAGYMGAVARFGGTAEADAAMIEAGWKRATPKLDPSAMTVEYGV